MWWCGHITLAGNRGLGVRLDGARANLFDVTVKDTRGDGTVPENLDIRYALVQLLYVDANARDVQVQEVDIITIALDRDESGILSELDTYPDDGTRYRLAPVTGLAAQVQGTGVRLTWDPHKDPVATLADFTDVFTGLPVMVVGPRSAPADLPALPPMGLVIEDGVPDGTGAVQVFVQGGDSITLSGQYTEAVGPVDIVASSCGPEFTAIANDGSLRLVLPIQQALWTVRVSEQTVADRDVTATVKLLKDEQSTVLSLDGAANRTVKADLMVISGQASDAETGIAEVYVSSDRLGEGGLQRRAAVAGQHERADRPRPPRSKPR